MALPIAAALVIAAVVAFAVLRPTTPDFVRPAADDYRLAVEGRLPLDVTTDDPAAFARWVDGTRRVAFPTTVLDLRQAGFRLRGGAIRARLGSPYVVAVYERDGEVVLSHHFRAADEGSDGDVATRDYVRANDLGFWVTRTGGVVRCVTSRLPAEEFERALLPLL